MPDRAVKEGDDAFEVIGNCRNNSPPHSTMMLSYRDKSCDMHSAGESGEQARERYGRHVFIILLHSLCAFLISQMVKTLSPWGPNSQIQRRFMLQFQGFIGNFKR